MKTSQNTKVPEPQLTSLIPAGATYPAPAMRQKFLASMVSPLKVLEGARVEAQIVLSVLRACMPVLSVGVFVSQKLAGQR